MYADQVEAAQANRSIKDRLKFNGSSAADSVLRQREDDEKWEHDRLENNEPQTPDRGDGVTDLRLKIQRKSIEQAAQGVKGSVSGGARDLREKLSGTLYSRPVEFRPLPLRPKPAPQVDSLDNFLLSLDLEKYSLLLQTEEVDMIALVHMSDADLKTCGIPMGPRKKILLALETKV